MKKFYIAILLSLIVFVLSGCSTIYRQYDGPTLQENEVAMLYPTAGNGYIPVINKIDEQWGWFAERRPSRYDLVPGFHTITVNWHTIGTRTINKPIELRFFAKAGHKYQVIIVVPREGKWTALILDQATQEIVSY